jgi:hypothetical protein
LHYNYHRYYDPTIGRYLRADPIGLTGGINVYFYVKNNPVNMVDLDGLAPVSSDGTVITGHFDESGTWKPDANKSGKCQSSRTREQLRQMMLDMALTLGPTIMTGGMIPPVPAPGVKLLGPGTKFGTKIIKQLSKRGWTKSRVQQTIDRPVRQVKTVDKRYLPGGSRLNDPATAYFRKDGSYVVRNNRTGDIVQVSNRLDPNWKAPF